LGAASDVAGRAGFEMALEDEDNTYRWAFGGDRRDMSMEVQLVAVNDRTFRLPQELRYLLPPDEAETSSPFTRPLRNLTYITAERIAPQEAYPLEDPRLVAVVGPRGEHAVSVLHWGRDEPVIAGLLMPDVPALLLHQVQRRMRTLFPGCEIDLQQPPRSNAVTLGLRTSTVTDFHNPVHTGFGLTQILPIVVAALSATKGDIILLENPEVHLHPAGQAMMGQFLADVANAGIQVIVETHSDHVLNGVRRAVKSCKIDAEKVAIHFFRPQSDDTAQVLSPTLDDSGNVDDWPEGFFDQFDKDSNYFAGWTED
jgi:predicted ATPase